MSEADELYNMVNYSHIIEARDLIKNITRMSDAKRSTPTSTIPECQQGFMDLMTLFSTRYGPIDTSEQNRDDFVKHWCRMSRYATLDDDEIFDLPPKIDENLIPYLVMMYIYLSGWMSEKTSLSVQMQSFGLQRIIHWLPK